MKRYVAAIALGATFFLAIAIMFMSNEGSSNHEPDAALMRHFRAHSVEYAELRDMITSDPEVELVSPGFIRLTGGKSQNRADRGPISPGRWNDYRNRMRSLGLPLGIEKNKDGSVTLYRSSEGLGIGGSMKGFVWSPRSPSPALASDDPRSVEELCSHAKVQYCYKRVADNWFIRYEHHH